MKKQTKLFSCFCLPVLFSSQTIELKKKNIWTENSKSVLFLYNSRFCSVSTDRKCYLHIQILVEVWQEGFSKNEWPPAWKNLQSRTHLPPQITRRKTVSDSCPSLSSICSGQKKRYTGNTNNFKFKINFSVEIYDCHNQTFWCMGNFLMETEGLESSWGSGLRT